RNLRGVLESIASRYFRRTVRRDRADNCQHAGPLSRCHTTRTTAAIDGAPVCAPTPAVWRRITLTDSASIGALMDFLRRSLILCICCVACTGALLTGQEAGPASKPRLTPEEMEAFLLKAKVTNRRDAGS